MREIVYLSDSKLRQFVPEPRRVSRTGTLRVTTPFGGVDMDAPASDGEQNQLRHLRKVHKHLDLVAGWYTDPEVRPGQWVRFEVTLRCITLNNAHQDLVLFVDSIRGRDTERATTRGCRLLMHGSSKHLHGWNSASMDGPELEVRNSGSSLATTFVTRAGQVVEELTRHRDPLPTDETLTPTGARLHSLGLRELLQALDDGDASIDTSAMMTGYARITGLLPGSETTPRCVVASPLIVEYSAADPDDALQ